MKHNESKESIGTKVLTQAMELYEMGIKIEATRQVLTDLWIEHGRDICHPAVNDKYEEFEALCGSFMILEQKHLRSVEEYKNKAADAAQPSEPFLHIVEGGEAKK